MDEEDLIGDVDDIIAGKVTPAYQLVDAVARDSAVIQSKQELVCAGLHYDFPPKLAFEYALNAESHASLCERYNLSPDEFKGLQASTTFQAYVATFKKDIAEFGLGFRMRARVGAETVLDITMDMIKSDCTPPAVRATLGAQVIKWADLEPMKKQAETDSPTVNIQINV